MNLKPGDLLVPKKKQFYTDIGVVLGLVENPGGLPLVRVLWPNGEIEENLKETIDQGYKKLEAR